MINIIGERSIDLPYDLQYEKDASETVMHVTARHHESGILAAEYDLIFIPLFSVQ